MDTQMVQYEGNRPGPANALSAGDNKNMHLYR